jgi:hypothetical protein
LSEPFRLVIPLPDAHRNLLAFSAPTLLPRVIRRSWFRRCEEPKPRTVLKMLANKCGLPTTMDRAFHEAVWPERLSHGDG